MSQADIMHKYTSANTHLTRMHSSRMRTARSSSRLLRGVCLRACWDTPPRCGPGDPPWMWAWRPILARTLNFPPGCGPRNLQCMLCTPPPPETCCKACWDTTPPVNRITDTCKNITCPNFVAGGKNRKYAW